MKDNSGKLSSIFIEDESQTNKTFSIKAYLPDGRFQLKKVELEIIIPQEKEEIKINKTIELNNSTITIFLIKIIKRK